MASTRLKSDQCSINKETLQSAGIYNWQTDFARAESNTKCRDELGLFNSPTLNLSLPDIVDYQSKLLGLGRVNTKCPEQMQLPTCSGNDVSPLLCAPRNAPKNGVQQYGSYNRGVLKGCSLVDSSIQKRF